MWTLKADTCAVIPVWLLSSWQGAGWRDVFLSVPCSEWVETDIGGGLAWGCRAGPRLTQPADWSRILVSPEEALVRVAQGILFDFCVFLPLS